MVVYDPSGIDHSKRQRVLLDDNWYDETMEEDEDICTYCGEIDCDCEGDE